MTLIFAFLSRLFDHWYTLLGGLMMIEPLIDYHWRGFKDWADKYISRQSRTRIATTISIGSIFISCFWAFSEEYSSFNKDEQDIHGKNGYEQQISALQKQVNDDKDQVKDMRASIEGHNGYKDQITEAEKQLGKVGSDLTFIQREKPQVVVQTKEVPVVIPSGAVQMTEAQEEKVKKMRIAVAGFLMTGQRFAIDVNNDNVASIEAQMQSWTQECVNYLSTNLDPSYAARFLDGSNVNPGITKQGISGRTQMIFQTVRSRNARLVEILEGLSK